MIDIFNVLYANGQNGIEYQQFEQCLQPILTKKTKDTQKVSFNTAENKLSVYTPSPPIQDDIIHAYNPNMDNIAEEDDEKSLDSNNNMAQNHHHLHYQMHILP